MFRDSFIQAIFNISAIIINNFFSPWFSSTHLEKNLKQSRQEFETTTFHAGDLIFHFFSQCRQEQNSFGISVAQNMSVEICHH